MDLFIVLLILHVLWMLIWSLGLQQRPQFYPHQATIHLPCHRYYQVAEHKLQQQRNQMVETMVDNYKGEYSTQSSETFLKQIRATSNHTVVGRSVDMLKNLFYLLFHIPNMFTHIDKLTWRRLVIHVQNNVWGYVNLSRTRNIKSDHSKRSEALPLLCLLCEC